MTYKIIELAIETLKQLAGKQGTSAEFKQDVNVAINALRNINKYL